MKKIFYIALVVVALLIIGQIMKKKPAALNEPEVVTVEEAVAVDETQPQVAPMDEEDVTVVDVEPAPAQAAVPTEEKAADTDENIVEQNPDTTADEGETVE